MQTKLHELEYPATTNASGLIRGIKCKNRENGMTVVFSTYHSIEVVHQAQQQGLGEFDLVICDEAHRTTGATFDGDKESAFVRIHDNDYINAKKRLYMTATPRIPRVKNAADFWAFSNAGREFAYYHLNFESVPMYDGVLFKGGLRIENDRIVGGADSDFYVEKMKHPKRLNPETGKNEDDPTKVIYNKKFTLENIPEAAYDYVVNGKPALEWVIERQSVKTDRASGIVNDANDWAIETMNNPRYPMELFLRVVTVSLETNRIVAGLPGLVV